VLVHVPARPQYFFPVLFLAGQSASPLGLSFFFGRLASPLKPRYFFPAAEEKKCPPLGASPHCPLRSRNTPAAPPSVGFLVRGGGSHAEPVVDLVYPSLPVLSSAQDMPNCGAQGASAVWPSDAGVRRPAAAGAPALQPLGTAFRGAQVTRKALLLSGLPMQGYEGQAAGWARKTELVTSFTSAAITARPGASRPPQTRRHGGRRAKRQQQARALAAQEAEGGGGYRSW
jgi:hypothetical protein